MSRVKKTAVNKLARMPMASDTAKPLHGPRSELVQDRRRHEHGDVGVDDGPEGAGEAGVDRGAHRLARAQLFADPLEDQDIGVHRHADGQHDPRDAGQRQRGVKPAMAAMRISRLRERATSAIRPESR